MSYRTDQFHLPKRMTILYKKRLSRDLGNATAKAHIGTENIGKSEKSTS